MKPATQYADAFDELETPIRNVERMSKIVLEKVMAAEGDVKADDLAVFTMILLAEMATELREQHERLAAGCRGDPSAMVPFRRRS